MPRELLTAEEHEAMDATASLYRKLAKIIGSGAAEEGDLNEVAFHIHGLQHMILSQAAARAYPDRYRPLGGDFVELKGVSVAP
jgi:hypothetical protein